MNDSAKASSEVAVPAAVSLREAFWYWAVLNSGQEIQDPKPASNALGTALLTLATRTRLLCYSISYTDFLGTETAVHFHAPASAGQNADILFFISPPSNGPSPLDSPKTGCVGPLTDKQMSNLQKGLSTSMFTVRRSLPERSAARSCSASRRPGVR
jgi:hypothetical protein